MTTLQSEDCQINDLNDSFPMALESLRFPLGNSMRIVFTGYFNGYNVEVRSVEEITLLYHMGCFGKGSASRSQPAAENENYPHIMRKRQFLKRNYWLKKFDSPGEDVDAFVKEVDEIAAKIITDSEKRSKKDIIDLVSSDEDNVELNESDNIKEYTEQFHSTDKANIVVIVSNSDSEDENYFANMKPKCCVNKIKIKEKLILMPEEAFFLLYGFGCLQIVNLDNTLLTIEKCWNLFLSADRNFILKYIVFHYYRSRGYIVKTGIKFGGEYLLYKDGPAMSHADYIVVIKNVRTSFDWITILGHVRMANTTVKEIIIVEVIEPEEGNGQLPNNLKDYSIREMLLNRNLPVIINDDDYKYFYLIIYLHYSTFII